VTEGAFSDDGAFHPLKTWDGDAVMKLFRERWRSILFRNGCATALRKLGRLWRRGNDRTVDSAVGSRRSTGGGGQYFGQIRKGERLEHYETVRKRKDGRIIEVALTVSPIKDKLGQIIGASKIVRDITERRRVESALRESEERFCNMANSAPVLIWISGTNKLCSWFNKPWLPIKTPAGTLIFSIAWSGIFSLCV